MKLFINQQEFTTDSDHITVRDLLALNQLPATGVAVAVNNKVIRKALWDTTLLSDNDNVTVITAVCGG